MKLILALLLMIAGCGGSPPEPGRSYGSHGNADTHGDPPGGLGATASPPAATPSPSPTPEEK